MDAVGPHRDEELIPRTTEDGSKTVYSRRFDQTYHSRHGALTESTHVFLEAGFHHRMGRAVAKPGLRILELGLGTGLNALLTLKAWRALPETGRPALTYVALEPHPLEGAVLAHIREGDDAGMGPDETDRLHARPEAEVHQVEWGKDGTFIRRRSTWQAFTAGNGAGQRFDLIYFDAFAPDSQPELWEEQRFREAFALLDPDGVLVTYCAKGSVRRALESAGFAVEKLPGPPGKREMLRATRPGDGPVPIRRFNVRVYGFILRDGPRADDGTTGMEVLLSDESIMGRNCTKWPGGGLEFGEGPEECLRREAEEEMAQDMRVGRLIHATRGFVRSAWRPEEQVLCHYYLAHIASPQLLRTSDVPFGFAPGSVQSFRWVPVAALREEDLTFATDREALLSLKEHLGLSGAGPGPH